MVPVWFSILFLSDVFQHAVEYLPGLGGKPAASAGCDAFVELEASLAMGIPIRYGSALGCAVCLWILQRHAYLHPIRLAHDALI